MSDADERWTKLNHQTVPSAENVCFCTCLSKEIGCVMVVSMTCRRTLNPSVMFILGMCYCSKPSTHRWWHFLRSPSSHWIGWSLTNQAVLPGASQSGFQGPQHLLRGLHSSPAACRWSPGVSGGPRQGCPLCPIQFWMAWVWTSCKGGSEMETRGRCVCMCGVFLCQFIVQSSDSWWRGSGTAE